MIKSVRTMVQTVRTTTRHRRAARTSLGDLVSPADPVYFLGFLFSLALITDNNDICHTSESIEFQSRQRHQLVARSSGNRSWLHGQSSDLADFVCMISLCVCVRVRMYACTYKTGSGTHPQSDHGFVPLVELPAFAR